MFKNRLKFEVYLFIVRKIKRLKLKQLACAWHLKMINKRK
jgi:hypothetical protein